MITGRSPSDIRNLIISGAINVYNDTFKIVLAKPEYTFSVSHANYSDISSYEVDEGNGYSIGGLELHGKNVSYNNTEDRYIMTFYNPSWCATNGTIIAGGAWIIDDTYTTKPVLSYFDFADVSIEDLYTFALVNITIKLP